MESVNNLPFEIASGKREFISAARAKCLEIQIDKITSRNFNIHDMDLHKLPEDAKIQFFDGNELIGDFHVRADNYNNGHTILIQPPIELNLSSGDIQILLSSASFQDKFGASIHYKRKVN